MLEHRYPLPDVGGHELSAVPDSAHLIVSTHAGVWRFDRDTHTFAPDPDLGGLHDVKSAVIDAATGRLAYTQAEPPEWWTSHIRFRHPDRDVHLAGRAPLQGAVGWSPVNSELKIQNEARVAASWSCGSTSQRIT